jgi:hypothetical protein
MRVGPPDRMPIATAALAIPGPAMLAAAAA